MKKLKSLVVASLVLLLSTGVAYAVVQSLNGVTGSTQTFVNDANISITSSASANTHTLGWSGALAISRGGTGVATLTNGSVLFMGATKVSESNNNFFWDSTNKRLGIGTNTPAQAVDVQGAVKAKQIISSAVSTADTNQSLNLNPNGTGRVVIGGDSLVVASRSNDPSTNRTGQIYFNTNSGKFRGYDGTRWRSLHFDPENTHSVDLESGSSQYLSIADGSQTGLDITGDWSMSVWVKLESQPPTNNAFVFQDKRETDTNGESMRYADESGVKALYARFKNGSSITEGHTNITLSTGVWTHVVFAVDISVPQIYIWVDNVAQTVSMDSSGATAIADSSAAFALGSQPVGGAYFDGKMDDVYVYDRLLTSGEVDDLFKQEGDYDALTSTDANLQGGWRLDNDNFVDQSGNGNTLTNNNSATFSTDTPF